MSAKKLTAILIIIFALIVLIGLIYFMFLAPVKETQAPVTQQATTTVTAQIPVTEVKTTTPKIIRREEVNEEDLKRLAASFVERYGSYSNQSGYANIRDLEIFMSGGMKIWATNYLEQIRNQNAATDIYYGITTKAVITETKQFNETGGQAEFLVKTQRKESIGVGANARAFQQDASISMIKEGGAWKVDRVKWGE
ncbi:MAG: hypothetical protein WCV41_00995 [Patescibacteria group bacterium]